MPSTKINAKLSPRLAAVANCVPTCGRVIDIGTDHALLPIALVSAGRCSQALAMDLRPGPLAAAARNIKASGIGERIEMIQADGLGAIEAQADDVVVISGLGGYEMMNILGKRPCRSKAVVLQPQKSIPDLRIWLTENGYRIEHEALAVEKHHTYVMMVIQYDGLCRNLTQVEQLVGPILAERQPPGFDRYLEGLLSRLAKQSRGEPERVEQIKMIKDQFNQSNN